MALTREQEKRLDYLEKNIFNRIQDSLWAPAWVRTAEDCKKYLDSYYSSFPGLTPEEAEQLDNEYQYLLYLRDRKD